MIYSQRDKRWKDIKLGSCKKTIGEAGCLVTIFAFLFDKTPAEINKLLFLQGGYAYGCEVWWIKAANILGFEFLGWGNDVPKYMPVIAEVKSKGQKHFVLVKSMTEVFDPYFGDVIRFTDRYDKVVSYRYIRIPEKPEDVIIKDFKTFIGILKKYLSRPCFN